jgi:hypothetical protein
VATINAIAGVCEAIKRILESTMDADVNELGLANMKPVFEVANSQKYLSFPQNNTITILLYRVLPNLSHRTPAGRLLSNGRRQRTRLPVDIHVLVTIWATSASTQNKLVAWTMRTLEDYPTLPSSLLNMEYPGAFGQDEAVELAVSELTLDETLNLWEKLSKNETTYQLSIPYVARAIFLESRREELDSDLVQTRQFDFVIHEGEDDHA